MARLDRILPAPGVPRLLTVSAVIASVGFGAFRAGSAVFFTRSVGIPTGTVGLGLSVLGVFAILGAVPAGRLADRFGPRETVIAGGLVDAALLSSLALVHGVPAFLVAMALLGLFGAIADVGREALLAGLIAPEERVGVAAYIRSALNLGFTIGAFIAGVVIAVDTRSVYVALVFWNVATLLVTIAIATRLPRVPPSPHAHVRSRAALRDRAYLLVAVTCGIVRTDQAILSIAIPLWVVSATAAPRVLSGWLIAVNTILVVLFQVRASRGADTLPGARRLQRRACVAVAAACVVLGAAGSVGSVLATLLLVAGVAVLTVGELWESAAEWAFRFDLADPEAQGAYGGVFELGSGVSNVVGPPLVTILTGALLFGGWLVLAGVFVVLFAVTGLVVDHAVRTRPVWATR